MAKYNLLDDDDIFEEKKDETASAASSGRSSSEIDINIDNDDFEIEPASLDDDQFQTDISQGNVSGGMEEQSEQYDEDPHFDDQPEVTEKKESAPSYYVDDYEDDKQEGINYKPFIKIAIVLLILTGIYFILDIFVFSESEQVAESEPVKTEEQLRLEREAAQKEQFIAKISGKLNVDVQNLTSTVNDVLSSAKVSSILYYGNSFLCEVFGTDRSEVARVNMAFKKAGRPFEVISSQARPGSKGGILSLYKLEVSSNSGSGQSNANFASINEFENWIQQTTNTSGLKIISLSNKSLGNESNFNKYEIETTINGSIEDCNNFLKKLASENHQAVIHKLNLSAMDQRTFKSGKYQLKLILELFV